MRFPFQVVEEFRHLLCEDGGDAFAGLAHQQRPRAAHQRTGEATNFG